MKFHQGISSVMNGYTCSIFKGKNDQDCKKISKKANEFFTDDAFRKRVLKPEKYFETMKTVAMKKLTRAEETTPLAFSILNHANIAMLEVILATIFRPQNSYCFYIDAKASDEYKADVLKLTNVYRYHFPNTTIILANPTLRIYWSGVSILEAGLDCMERLYSANSDWKFFLNAIGSALPGRPIQELTEVFSRLNGDIVASVPLNDQTQEYITHKYLMTKSVYPGLVHAQMTPIV